MSRTTLTLIISLVISTEGSSATLFALPHLTSTVQGHSLSNSGQPSALYYGWFFNQVPSGSLTKVTQEYLAYAYNNVKEVKDFLNQISHEGNVSEPLKYFKKPPDPNTGDPDPYYHITTKFCGGPGQPPPPNNCTKYYKKVQKLIGTPFHMNLIGVFFTQRTFGIRILLTKKQRPIFENGNDPPKPKYPGLRFIKQKLNFKPSVSTAHITLGTGPGIPPFQTGPDLFGIVKAEHEPGQSYKDYSVPMGILRKYWNDTSPLSTTSFVFYLNRKIVAKALFKPYLNPI